jgi:trans-2,3-dihydro-3-hydroxyanthranilate isomerase
MKSYRYKVRGRLHDRGPKEQCAGRVPGRVRRGRNDHAEDRQELNLTETAFVLPATREDCAASLRIFTPAKELEFAGHPMVGGAFVLLEEGIVPKNSRAFVVQEQIGPVPIRIGPGPRLMIWLRTPPIREGRCYDSALCAAALGLEPQDFLPVEPQLVNAGNPTVIVAAKDKAAVDRAWLDLAGLKSLKGGESEPFCVFGATGPVERAS